LDLSLTGFNKKKIEETEITTETKYLKELELKEQCNFDKP
jgi:hypothetical protein